MFSREIVWREHEGRNLGETQLQMGMCDCRDYYVVALPLREYTITTDVIEELNTDVFAFFTEHSN